MATLILEVQDSVLEYITEIAAEGNQNTAQVAAGLLTELVTSRRQNGAEPEAGAKTYEEQMLEVLAPFWAEEDRWIAQGNVPPQTGKPGDVYEAYLQEHWAEDLQKENSR